MEAEKEAASAVRRPPASVSSRPRSQPSGTSASARPSAQRPAPGACPRVAHGTAPVLRAEQCPGASAEHQAASALPGIRHGACVHH